ncbi:MAG: L,D-transpeptidase family protein [Pseudomonadota bacterium]
MAQEREPIVNGRDRKSKDAKSVIIRVRRKPGQNPALALLQLGTEAWPCRLGSAGMTARKREGDGATPIGRYELLRGHVRQDRTIRRRLRAERLRPISRRDGWCDAPDHAAYNRAVKLPFAASHERLWRKDRLYDLMFALDWNMHRRSRNRGSAIFFHLAPDDPEKGTEGCLALAPHHMEQMLQRLDHVPGPIIFDVR